MNTMRKILGTILVVFFIALISLAASAVFCATKWIFQTPTWADFWGGGLGLFALFLIMFLIYRHSVDKKHRAK